MKLGKILLGLGLLASTMLANDFVDYKSLTKKLKADAKKEGNYATTAEVKEALKAKDWAVVDVRKLEEWAGAYIEGSVRVGRQSPELALANIVTDIDDKLVKDKLIVVCNSASRASIEAQAFRQMGFKK